MTIDQLNTQLKRLQWDYQHPRVQAFCKESSVRLKRQILTPADLPPKYISHLTAILNACWECFNYVRILAIDWSDPMIIQTFKKYGQDNRMPLKGWLELADSLDKRWFESGGGF